MIVGLFVKHLKAYKNINFIPVGSKYNFVSYIGENGVGKSSILESLNCFFNSKLYPINKSALRDSIKTTGNEPFIALIFLINKAKVTRQKKEFEHLSEFFWSVNKNSLHSGIRRSMNDFFDIRENLISQNSSLPDTHYLFIAGENDLDTSNPKLSFASFNADESFMLHMTGGEKIKNIDPTVEPKKDKLSSDYQSALMSSDWKKFYAELKNLYSYVYFPVELDAESFTKIETDGMQKIFDKRIKDEIEKALSSVKFTQKNGINQTLSDFLSQIEDILDGEYCYHTGLDRSNSVTKTDLTNKIIEVYFQKRFLYKKNNGELTKITELSAGEKRQALITLIYAFLKVKSERERMVIIGIDEPENSLHTTLCYEQFERLKEISSNSQILITTHWYGFLPVISEGYGHFINSEDGQITFESYDLYDYNAKVKQQIISSKSKYPSNMHLKSTYDLVQSIFYSLKRERPNNWIICEGITEKIYLEHFLKDDIARLNLRILPMGGSRNVIRLYEYLKTPIREDDLNGKVFCLIDTDNVRPEDIGAGSANLVIKRFNNSGTTQQTSLVNLNNGEMYLTDVERSLNPLVFREAINELAQDDKFKVISIENESGNSDFINNFRNTYIQDFFKINEGANKIIFAEKYVEKDVELREAGNTTNSTPKWVSIIVDLFNKKTFV